MITYCQTFLSRNPEQLTSYQVDMPQPVYLSATRAVSSNGKMGRGCTLRTHFEDVDSDIDIERQVSDDPVDSFLKFSVVAQHRQRRERLHQSQRSAIVGWAQVLQVQVTQLHQGVGVGSRNRSQLVMLQKQSLKGLVPLHKSQSLSKHLICRRLSHNCVG